MKTYEIPQGILITNSIEASFIPDYEEIETVLFGNGFCKMAAEPQAAHHKLLTQLDKRERWDYWYDELTELNTLAVQLNALQKSLK